MTCTTCRVIGDGVSWGDSNMAEKRHPPDAVDKLKEIDQDTRECPECGARFRYDIESEAANDRWMPDMRFTLTRIR